MNETAKFDQLRAIQEQFGDLPEIIHSDPQVKCRVARYDPDQGYVCLESIAGIDKRILSFVMSIGLCVPLAAGQASEYLLIDKAHKLWAGRSQISFFERGRVKMNRIDLTYKQLDRMTKYTLDDLDKGPASEVDIEVRLNKHSVGADEVPSARAKVNTSGEREVYMKSELEGMMGNDRDFLSKIYPGRDLKFLFDMLLVYNSSNRVMMQSGSEEIMIHKPRARDSSKLAFGYNCPFTIPGSPLALEVRTEGDIVTVHRTNADTGNSSSFRLFRNYDIAGIETMARSDGLKWAELFSYFPAELTVVEKTKF